MKDKQTEEEHDQTPDILSPGASAVQANKKPKDSKKLKKESSDRRRKKWSLFRHFREATHIKKLQWIGSTVVVLTGIGVLGVYILDYIQRQEQFSVEHRPKVIVSRPPTLLSAFRCQVTDRAIHFFTGPMQAWVKNIKNEDAINAFVVGPQLQLIPTKKSGNAFFDELPRVEGRCKQKLTPKTTMFPVHSGEALGVNIAQSAGVMSLVRVNQMSVTMGGGPQPEPETPKGEKEERIEVAKDAVFQLYAPICVYYSDKDGVSYGSCRTYRLNIAGGRFPNDPYSFSCPDTPVTGIFEETFANYCEE